jgi:apolipoprotein N-acyltransferase
MNHSAYMTDQPGSHEAPGLSRPWAKVGLPIASLAVFHAAWLPGFAWATAFFPLLFLPALKPKTARRAFYLGLGIGLGLAAPKLGFFWTRFGPPAVALWLVLAFWIGAFAAIGQALGRHWQGIRFAVAVPILWMGFEFFRSELYSLRFTWITPGHALSDVSGIGRFHWLGIHGTGAALLLAPSSYWFCQGRIRPIGLGLVVVAAGGLATFPHLPVRSSETTEGRSLRIAGAQIEGVDESRIPAVLDQIVAKDPKAELIVLPEYSLEEPPGLTLTSWYQRHRLHLVIGGKETVGTARFRNPAWVVGPEGNLVFNQVKSVPIRFFNDGESATRQSAWWTPWGALGMAICYDLSYSRVMDELIRHKAEALLIPTMDSFAWGAHQHALHARIAPIRAAEYGIPIVRSASSGVSQIVDAQGHVTASAPCSEEVLFFAGTSHLRGPRSLPWDRWLAPAAAAVSGSILVWLVWTSFRNRPLPTSSVSLP